MCSQFLQDFNNYPARDVFTISSKILGQIRPEMCSQSLQDFNYCPARDVFTISSKILGGGARPQKAPKSPFF